MPDASIIWICILEKRTISKPNLSEPLDLEGNSNDFTVGLRCIDKNNDEWNTLDIVPITFKSSSYVKS